MDNVYNIIIIGGGPAGYSAALYSARAGLDTLIIEKMSAGGQMALTGDIENYPGFEDGIDGFTLGMKMQKSATRFGAKTEYGEVTDLILDGDIKKVITSAGERYAKAVIIATGANPRELGIEGEAAFTGRGIHYCAHCDGRFYKDKTVIVVGGGNSAAEDALHLSKLAKKVYLVHRRDELRADRIYKNRLADAGNIEFIWNSEVISIIAELKLTGALIRDLQSGEESSIDCDGIFVSIGRVPATSFLDGKLLLDKNGYIIADESTKTSIDGVYAAGDVRTKSLRQVVTAVADGAVAVNSASEYLG